MNLALTDEIAIALSHGRNAVVAVGVSGGKDSCAVALATNRYLKEIGFSGKFVLIHSDLGKTEWKESLPKCKELADHLGTELIVVRRKAGGMLERWQGRWDNNVQRYSNLECVKLILPWSTASMRFCTSELKTAPICAELKKRFPGHVIISTIGIRREESTGRAKAPVSKPNPKLQHKTIHKETGIATSGYDWNPIIEWKLDDVFKEIKQSGLELHEAYTKYGMSRVSCAFCILSNACDLRNASLAPENQDLYREMVELEIVSTFSFQTNKWLGDVHHGLLSRETLARLAKAKLAAFEREQIEDAIPDHLLYTKGWPTSVPTYSEASLLAGVRSRVGDLLSIEMKYTSADDIINRYQELMDMKGTKNEPAVN